jgi:hypothetical protein
MRYLAGSNEAVPNLRFDEVYWSVWRYVIFHGTSVKNGRKLVQRRRKWISLVIPLSPARGKSSRPNEPNATYRRSKREKSTGVSIRNPKDPLF